MKTATCKNLYKQNQKQKQLLSVMYQVAGVHDLPVEYLDALIAAIDDEPFTVDGLLPYCTKESEYIHRLETFILALYRTTSDPILREKIYTEFADVCFAFDPKLPLDK